MAIYVQACDLNRWDVIMDGLFIQKKRNTANKDVLKPMAEWTADDKAKIQLQSHKNFSLCFKLG
ncbi:hypothetical protein REPUB_Repub11eG0086700 [Reevesia pubescens]